MLRDTIILDCTWNEALDYRCKCLNQNVEVGTIFTLKDGARIDSDGRFSGGERNYAPNLRNESYQRYGILPTFEMKRLMDEVEFMSTLSIKAENEARNSQKFESYLQRAIESLKNLDCEQTKLQTYLKQYENEKKIPGKFTRKITF